MTDRLRDERIGSSTRFGLVSARVPGNCRRRLLRRTHLPLRQSPRRILRPGYERAGATEKVVPTTTRAADEDESSDESIGRAPPNSSASTMRQKFKRMRLGQRCYGCRGHALGSKGRASQNLRLRSERIDWTTVGSATTKSLSNRRRSHQFRREERRRVAQRPSMPSFAMNVPCVTRASRVSGVFAPLRRRDIDVPSVSPRSPLCVMIVRLPRKVV